LYNYLLLFGKIIKSLTIDGLKFVQIVKLFNQLE
jgi:hypothetical protein